MDLKTFTINENEITFVNLSRSTRNGFAHDSELFINGVNRGKNTCHYYNRTWESYRYQSVMRGLVFKLIDERKNRLKDDYKYSNGIKRLTAKHLEQVDDIIKADGHIQLLQAIKDKLNEH